VQEGHAEPVHQADQQADAEPHRDRPRAAHRGRQHGAGRDRPRHRQIDVPEQDHDHHAGRDGAEERGDLELLQQIDRRDERRGALRRQRVGGAGDQDDEDEAAGDQRRAVDGARHWGGVLR